MSFSRSKGRVAVAVAVAVTVLDAALLDDVFFVLLLWTALVEVVVVTAAAAAAAAVDDDVCIIIGVPASLVHEVRLSRNAAIFSSFPVTIGSADLARQQHLMDLQYKHPC